MQSTSDKYEALFGKYKLDQPFVPANRSYSASTTKEDVLLALTSEAKTHAIALREAQANQLRWEKHFAAQVELTLGSTGPIPIRIGLQITTAAPRDSSQTSATLAALLRGFSEHAVVSAAAQLSKDIQSFWDAYQADMGEAEKALVLKALKRTLVKGVSFDTLSPQTFKAVDWLSGPAKEVLQRIDASRASEMLRIQDYAQSFPLARRMHRKFHLRLGPTNSGKTHGALEALRAAHSGVYLAPLRLLAIEVRDRLVASGIPCSLITGEEKDIIPGARHVSSTIEMLSSNTEYQVAVIDEIQMLEDPSRGWAWTAALAGVAASEVYVCGVVCALPACKKILDHTRTAYTVTELDRKSPLELQPFSSASKARTGRGRGRKADAEGLDKLKAGDALIAFSRKSVLSLSAQCRMLGYTVASIYGALAPEVRRREAERFATGQAQVLVATDAIGMGLNLPISRVVFSKVQKFDGNEVRTLTASEAQQIAGRAGRFGLADKGVATTLEGGDLATLKELLAQKLAPLEGKLSVAPTPVQVCDLGELLGTERIGTLLSFFANQLVTDSPIFQPAALSDAVALGHSIDRIKGVSEQLSLIDKFTFACAPVTQEKEGEFHFFTQCLSAYGHGYEMPLPAEPRWLGTKVSPYKLQDAELLSKNLSLYAWLSFKFPQTFTDGPRVAALRRQVSDYIEAALLLQTPASVAIPG